MRRDAERDAGGCDPPTHRVLPRCLAACVVTRRRWRRLWIELAGEVEGVTKNITMLSVWIRPVGDETTTTEHSFHWLRLVLFLFVCNESTRIR